MKVPHLISPWTTTEENKGTYNNYSILKYGNIASITADLDNIARWEQRNQKKHIQNMDEMTGEWISNMLIELLEYLEECYNANARSPPLVRIPTKLFFDVRTGGAVCYIILAILKFKNDKKIKNFKFKNPAFADLNTELIMAIHRQLCASDYINLPKIYLSREIPEDKRKYLEEIARKNQAMVTTNKNIASHILYHCSNERKFSEEVNDILIEPVWKCSDMSGQKWVFNHYVGFPDSYWSFLERNDDLFASPS